MPFATLILCLSILVCSITSGSSAQVAISAASPAAKGSTGTENPPAPKRIVIAASTVLDGKGRVLHNTRIVIEGSKIAAIDPKAGPVMFQVTRVSFL